MSRAKGKALVGARRDSARRRFRPHRNPLRAKDPAPRPRRQSRRILGLPRKSSEARARSSTCRPRF